MSNIGVCTLVRPNLSTQHLPPTYLSPPIESSNTCPRPAFDQTSVGCQYSRMVAMLNAVTLLVASYVSFVLPGVHAAFCSGYISNKNYCPHGCCTESYSDGCCSWGSGGTIVTYSTTFNVVAIAVGCSIGGIVLIAIIITIICCCVRRRGSRGQVLGSTTGQPTVVTTTTNNMSATGASGQYPMQPTANPWYPPPQPYPQYPAQPAGSPGYGQQIGLPPPQPYTQQPAQPTGPPGYGQQIGPPPPQPQMDYSSDGLTKETSSPQY